MTYPSPNFDYLHSLIGPYGIFEHAEHDRPRTEHGYCVDDVARVLLVTARELDPSPKVMDLARMAVRFLEQAQSIAGTFTNRRAASGRFIGRSTNEDCWGRAVWALGVSVTRCGDDDIKRRASTLLQRSLVVRSPWPRSMAFATLGAVEVIKVDATAGDALSLVQDATVVLDRPNVGDGWEWPEDRLSYANAVLPEALMAAGSVLGNDRLVAIGLEQLRWLLSQESKLGRLSVTSSLGRHRSAGVESFDQQPIEVAALCDACARAFELTGDAKWLRGVELSADWFLGKNDGGVVMFDPLTGGGYDGLTERGPNLNRGAESTLALLATLQTVRHAELVR
ncbi:MAG: hypothetical protein WAN30_03370 [Acidimicrobiales bacterium]